MPNAPRSRCLFRKWIQIVEILNVTEIQELYGIIPNIKRVIDILKILYKNICFTTYVINVIPKTNNKLQVFFI